jgi:hypothetical protein
MPERDAIASAFLYADLLPGSVSGILSGAATSSDAPSGRHHSTRGHH